MIQIQTGSQQMNCNQEKAQNILLSLSEKQDTPSVELLGTFIENNLCWSKNISSICKKISRVNYLFSRLRGISMVYLRMSYVYLLQSHTGSLQIQWWHAKSVSDFFDNTKSFQNYLSVELAHTITITLLPTPLYIYMTVLKKCISMFTTKTLISKPTELVHSHLTRTII